MKIKTKEDILNYLNIYKEVVINEEVIDLIITLSDVAIRAKSKNKKIIFFGNGASASTAEHASVDLLKQAKINTYTPTGPNLITCFSNDYGYENWMSQVIQNIASDGDVIVLISVSGESESIVNAGKLAKKLGLYTATFTGRNINNSVKQLGDLNFYVDSDAYNIIENTHSIWITACIDYIIGKSVYETRNRL